MPTIATWNVNSVRARLPRLLAWLAEQRPDVVALQETKCLEEVFPREAIEDAGYLAVVSGQKTYNGVAILARSTPEAVEVGLGDPEFDHEARVITAIVSGFVVVNAYVVNGKEVGADAYAHKLRFMSRLARHVRERQTQGGRLVVLGDFNVTFDDRDVFDPEAWRGKIHCSEPERTALGEVVAAGVADTFRHFEQGGGHYTWWDFRTRGFQRGDGLRIDHVLASPAAFATCTGVRIDRDARAGEKPSDHAPVVATFAD